MREEVREGKCAQGGEVSRGGIRTAVTWPGAARGGRRVHRNVAKPRLHPGYTLATRSSFIMPAIGFANVVMCNV